ncbi:glycosyltransferase [Sulfitobacter sp.]|uniref:glycosyltransferase n=1 Tax=Sulfitobacter sp. TaxID=1903071 RepID=UPI003563DB6E
MVQVLFHRPTVWASDIQCSTKVLARLTAARGYDTDYLQAPLDPAHLLRGPGGYLRVWRDSPRNAGGVNILTPATPVPVRDVWPLNGLAAASLRYRTCIPSLSRIGSPDLVWTTVPGSGRAMKKAFPAAKVVFHVVDYYPAFRGEAVKSLERDDYAAVDAVATISGTLTDYLTGELGVPRDKITTLGQGVEVDRYAPDLPEPELLADMPHPRAIWTGVLTKGDAGLFAEVAKDMAARGGSLVLIGPGAEWADQLAKAYPSMVRLIGPVAPTELPGWLVHCDLGIMLYDRARQDVYRGQNPLKLYEYAAAGLPVLSTPHDEYAQLDPPAAVLSHEAEVAPAIADALTQSNSPGQAARAFVAARSWDAKLDTIFDLYLPQAS